MTRIRAILAVVCVTLPAFPSLLSAGQARPAPAAPQPAGPLAAILAKIPNDDAAAAMAAYNDLVALGPQGIKDLAALLVEPGPVDDSRARLAFHGLALYVARPGAEAERMMFCETVRGLLAGPAPASIKGFFLRQLRLAGCPKAVPAVSALLLDEELCEYAAQTLVTIGGDEARAALRQALAKAQGKCRLTIIQNLGVLRDAQAAPELMKATTDADREARLAALWALANIGDAAAADTILKATEAQGAYERAKTTDAALLLAQRLGEAQKAREAEQIYRALWKAAAGPKDRHVRCAAIRGLAAALGAGAMDDLVAAMKGDDPQVRAAVAEAALAMPGEDVTQKWIQHMKTLPPAARGDVLAMLGRRGGPAAEDAVLEATRDADASVRLAAIQAAETLSDEKAAAAIMALLTSAVRPEQEAARAALGRMPGDKVTAAVAAAVAPSTGGRTGPSAAPAAKRELLGILVARGARAHLDVLLAAATDADSGVRAAGLAGLESLGDEKTLPALLRLLVKAAPEDRQAAEKTVGAVCSRAGNKEAAADLVIKAMGGVGAPTRAALIRILGTIGGEKALAEVRASAKDTEVDIQDAAIRAMADWPDAGVAPDLLEIARTNPRPAHQVLALRGYVRLANVPAGRPVAEKLKMYQEAMAVAKRPDEKRLVLGAMGDLKSPEALQKVLPLVADEDLKEEASAAAVKIAKALNGNPKAAIQNAMEKVLAASKNAGTRKDAEDVLKKLK
jgi:HEAT repeat protein